MVKKRDLNLQNDLFFCEFPKGLIRENISVDGKMESNTGKAPSSLQQDKRKKVNGKTDNERDGSFSMRDALTKKWKILKIDFLI
jgi:hypothetical protein